MNARPVMKRAMHGLVMLGALAGLAPACNAAVAQRMEKQGVAIDFSLTPVADSEQSGVPVAGSDAIVTFKVSDARTGQPLSGARPRAWFNARHSEMVANEAECTDKIRTLVGGNLAKRADIDLNSYLVLTLNHDKTITIINPQISFNITKLESIVALPAKGADWVLSRDRKYLYVTLPDASAVAIIDTTTRKLLTTLSTGDKTTPRRIALQPDGRYVWIGLDNAPQVVAIDTATRQVAAKIAVGGGLHNMAFTADSRYAYVTNSASDTVTAIDLRKLARISDIAAGRTPTAIAHGPASKLIYVASLNDAAISVIDPDKQQVIASIPLASRGVVALAFEPGGRHLVAANQLTDTVYVIDTATQKVSASAQVVKEPDQVVFSDRYAYVRGLGSEKFSLIDLNELKNGRLSPLDIQAGRLAPSAAPEDIGVAGMIAPTPEGNAVMIANAPDRMLYFYQEGMMAPMGTFSNYKRKPHALMILDRSLAETAPGTYSAPVKLGKSGRFDVPVLIDQPRLINCFRVTVADEPGAKTAAAGSSVRIEALFETRQPASAEPQKLSFRISDTISQQPIRGLTDVQALLIEPPGTWQQRRKLTEVGVGVYAFEQAFAQVGSLNLLLEIPSRGVRYSDLRPTVLEIRQIEARR
jgi:YVTN family beta-propeller protein